MNESFSSLDVSVVMAVRNEQTHVESAVRSILEQTGLNHELIVVDDNSTDRTPEILASLAASQTKLLVIRNGRSGKCSAFNLGVSQARGRFVCIFAGDDLMPQNSLADRYARVRNLPQDTPVVGLCKLVTMSEIKKFDGHVVPRAPGRGALSGVSPLMNGPALSKMFPVPETLPNEDTWMELAVTYFPGWHVVHSDVIGCFWRVHEGNSINMLSTFDDYNRKITARLRAIPLFYEQFKAELDDAAHRELQARIRCEEARQRGSILGILGSPVGIVEKLRSLSIVNRYLYAMRQRFYGLLSGW